MGDEFYLDHDKTEESLSAQLPRYMPKDPQSGNYKLLSTLAERVDSLDEEIEQIDRASTVQTADTIEELTKLAQLANLNPTENEDKEHFRARIIAEFQLLTSEGAISDLLNSTSVILDTTINSLEYTEYPDTLPGNCRLDVPASKLQSIKFTNSEFVNIVESLIPSGYSIEVVADGTFEYVSESEYLTDNYNTTSGYSTLDASGDPIDSGGTYSGLLE